MPRATSVTEIDEDSFVDGYRLWESDRCPENHDDEDKEQEVTEGFLRIYHRRAVDRTLGTFERNLWAVADLSRAWTDSPVRLDFAPIEQHEIREQVKSACVKLLADGADPAQLENGLEALTRLCIWLNKAAPEIVRLEDITRMETARYIATFKQGRTKQKNGAATEPRKIKGMLSQIASTSGGPVLSVSELFEPSDLAPSATRRLQPFSIQELRALNHLLPQMDIQAARIAVVLQRTDASFGEVARLGRECLMKDESGDSWLLYGRRKNGSTKGIRVDKSICAIINAAIKDSIKQFGGGCMLVFACPSGSDETARCMTSAEFSAQISRASRACEKRDDTGNFMNYSRGSFKGSWLCDASSLGLTSDVFEQLGRESA